MHAVLARELITVIAPQSYLNAVTVGEFHSELNAAFANPGLSTLLVNLEKVEFLDSSGLLALVSGLKRAKSLNKRFSICSVPPAIRMIFELSQLDQVFDIFEMGADFETAIAHNHSH